MTVFFMSSLARLRVSALRKALEFIVRVLIDTATRKTGENEFLRLSNGRLVSQLDPLTKCPSFPLRPAGAYKLAF